mgnify:CR=1 FL=1
MSIVKIDASNEGNFESRSFKILPKGKYIFEVANEPIISQAKSSGKNKVDITLKCADDGEYKGSSVFDCISLSKKSEWKLCHLVLACGTQSEDDMKNNGIDLSLLKGATLEAEVDVQPATVGADGKTYNEKNRITRYLFEPENK